MDAKKISRFCQPFRIALGTTLIGYGVYSGNGWFYLGAIPLIAGIINFCPLCGITKQCNLIGKK
jgi:hypothetical protein